MEVVLELSHAMRTPVALLGRDVLGQVGLKLTNEHFW